MESSCDACGWSSGARAKETLWSIWHGSRMTHCVLDTARILVGAAEAWFVRWSLGAETFNLLSTKQEAVGPGRKDKNEAGHYAQD
jgi:hypothetical protein